MTKTERLLMALIALPSVNPAFASVGDGNAGERRVAEFLAATAAEAGLDVEFQPVLPDRPNLIVRVAPKGKLRRRILLAPHLDTVPPADAVQLTPRRRDGRIFGRGACDTKGSVAAMFSAMAAFAHAARRPANTEIVFAGLADEESAQAGSRALAASGLKADLAIVGEPTGLRVVTAHKGSVWLELRTRGRAAHGARPELGRNAVHEMARIVDLIETDYATELRRRRHPLLGTATVSVGTIGGGTQPNVVPNDCAMTLDRRTLPGETEATVRREITALLSHRKLRATFSNAKLAPCLPLETNAKLEIVSEFLRSVGRKQPIGVPYFCDAAVLSEGGIPSVVFGPGEIAQAHTADEWISTRSLERAKDILVNYLTSLT